MPAYFRDLINSFAALPEFRHLLFWLIYGLPWALLIRTLRGSLKTVLWLYLATFLAGLAIYIQVHVYEMNWVIFAILLTLPGAGAPMFLIGKEFERAGYPPSPKHFREGILTLPGFAQVSALLYCLYIWSGSLSARLWPEHFGIRSIRPLREADLPLKLEERYWTMSKRFLFGLAVVLFGEFFLFLGMPVFGYLMVISGCLLGGTAYFTHSTVISRDGLTISRLFRKPCHLPWSAITSFDQQTPSGPAAGIKINLKSPDLWPGNNRHLPSNYGYAPKALSAFLNDLRKEVGSGGGT